MPIGIVTWALVDAAVEKRLAAGELQLAPQEWKCGDRLWLIDLVAPFGGVREIVKDFRERVFPDRTIRYAVPDFERKGVRVVEWNPKTGTEEPGARSTK